MAFQAGDQIAVGGLLDHLGERFDNLLLGVIDVLKAMKQQILHGFDVFGKKSHSSLLLAMMAMERRGLFAVPF
jgi:hypothetical protein